MSKLFAHSLLLPAMLLCSGAFKADATTITFDDVSVHNNPAVTVTNGYAGLNWNNFAVLDGTTLPGSGFSTGTVSGTHVAFNNNGTLATLASSTGAFSFNSGYFTSAWVDGLQVTVQGFLGGVIQDSTTFIINTHVPTLETFAWTNVDSVAISASDPSNLDITATEFVLDNLTINAPKNVASPAPEPSSCAVLGLSILAIGRLSRRKSSKLLTGI